MYYYHFSLVLAVYISKNVKRVQPTNVHYNNICTTTTYCVTVNRFTTNCF